MTSLRREPTTEPTRHRPSLPARRRGDVHRERLELVVSTLGGSPSASVRDVRRQFEELLADARPDAVWLALAVLDGELPDPETVVRTVRTVRLDGPAAAFEHRLSGWMSWLTEPRATRPVEILRGGVLVDIEHTSRTGLATGIQRVARQTIQRWVDRPGVVLGAWTRDHRALRLLDEGERQRALTGVAPPDRSAAPTATVVIPWESSYVLPELSSEPDRNVRLAALAQFARSRTGVIGYDCVPVTSAETVNVGVSGTFIGNLGAVRYMNRVAAISEAAATEYRGWRHMLSAAGIQGPDVTSVPLPSEAEQPGEETLAAARQRFVAGTLPMVLVVGTHEPRKNHLAVLHAAETLWRGGQRFSLTFVGGNAWHSERFTAMLDGLHGQGRPVESVTALPDDHLWALYDLASFVVFPSLNEGFGLPAAEALACGTPVITSNFGSMREIAADGGALLVDPRDDHDIARAMRSLLTDSSLRSRLRNEALARPRRTWDQYADELWDALVEPRPAGS